MFSSSKITLWEKKNTGKDLFTQEAITECQVKSSLLRGKHTIFFHFEESDLGKGIPDYFQN